MASRDYSFIDIAVLDAVRTRFSAGDALAILSTDLEEVIWANGPGAAVFGYPDISSVMGASARLPFAARRQITATPGFPDVGNDRPITVRLASGVTSHAVGFLASRIALPDGEDAILLAVPASHASSRAAREIAERAIGGFSEPGSFVALVDQTGAIAAASEGFSALGVSPDTLAMLVAAVRGEADRVVKRLIPAGSARLPAGIARLTDDPAQHLLLVIDEDQAADERNVEEPVAGTDDTVDASGSADGAPAPTFQDDEPQISERPEEFSEDDFELVAEEAKPSPVDVNTPEPDHDKWYFSAGEMAANGPRDTGEAGASGKARPDDTSVEPAEQQHVIAAQEPDHAIAPAIDRAALPVRFVWRTDADGRFTTISEEFATAVGGPAADVIGRSFREVATAFGFDPSHEIASLLERRDTWSGRSVLWPVAGTDLRVPVDLAALPVYGRSRDFEGFRGFGVARAGDAVVDPEGLGLVLTPGVENAAGVDTPSDRQSAAPAQPDDPFKGEVPALTIVPKPDRRFSDKVIRLAEHRPPTEGKGLTQGERSAFREIGDRLKKDAGPAGVPPSADNDPLPGFDTPADIVAPSEPTISEDEADSAAFWPAPEKISGNSRDDAETRADDPIAPASGDPLEPLGFEAEQEEADSPIASAIASDESVAEDGDAAELIASTAEEPPAETSQPEESDFQDIRVDKTADEAVDASHSMSLDEDEATPDDTVPDAAGSDEDRSADHAPHGEASDKPADDTRPLEESSPEDTGPDHTRGEDLDADALPFMSEVEDDIEERADAALNAADSGEDWPHAEKTDDEARIEASILGVSPHSAEHPETAVPYEDRPTTDASRTGEEEPAEFTASDERAGSAATNDAADDEVVATDVPGIEPEKEASQQENARTDEDARPIAAGGFLPSAFAGGERRAGVDTSILDRLPIPVLIHSGDTLHYANREFLDFTAYASVEALAYRGGLGELFADPYEDSENSGDRKLRLLRADGLEVPVEAFLQSLPWAGGKALLLSLRRVGRAPLPAVMPPHDKAALEARVAEMRTIIDTATDGVVLIAQDGAIRSISRPAEALFGFESDEVAGKPFASLFAIESQRAARDYLNGLSDNGVASVLNDGREVIGRESQGRFIPLFMTIGRLPGDSGYCAVVRDITQWKRAEEELTQSRAQAERASSQKTDFLARVSHEIRTPLNAIIGFSELMMDEKFGPVGNDRYRDYLRDINRSGNHVLDLVNDLLDISKIEAGQQEMAYEAVSLNDTLAEAVAMMQPQANRERVIIRSSFASRLPEVVADLRSIRQIALNLLSNAVRYTQAGGQVIVSTSYEASGDIVMRVRDTGIGMSTAEIEQALKPFKQINALKRGRGDGTGLGLPLTKAMVEANRAKFQINSTPGEGTLVEVTFPSTRVLAE